jgi:hypothetical protein
MLVVVRTLLLLGVHETEIFQFMRYFTTIIYLRRPFQKRLSPFKRSDSFGSKCDQCPKKTER